MEIFSRVVKVALGAHNGLEANGSAVPSREIRLSKTASLRNDTYVLQMRSHSGHLRG